MKTYLVEIIIQTVIVLIMLIGTVILVKIKELLGEMKYSENKEEVKEFPAHYKKILHFQYQRKLLKDNSQEMSILNEMEAADCPLKCIQIHSVPSAGMRVDMHKEYPTKKYFDETRSMDMYTFFVDVAISPEEQITRELAWKIRQGFMPEQKDFLPEKKIWTRYSLNEKEFSKYFKLVD